MNDEVNSNIEIIKDIILKNGLVVPELTLLEKTYNYDIEAKEIKYINQNCLFKGPVSYHNYKKLMAFKNEIEGKLHPTYEIKVELMNIDFEGIMFPLLLNVLPILNEGTGSDIQPKNGDITIYEFWSIYWKECQINIQHLLNILKANIHWIGKVRVIAVSIDSNINEVKGKILSNNWTDIEHYAISEIKNNTINEFFNLLHQIPFCVVVGKDGKIKLNGNNFRINLELNIQRLLDGNSIIKPPVTLKNYPKFDNTVPNEEQSRFIIEKTLLDMNYLSSKIANLSISLNYHFYSEGLKPVLFNTLLIICSISIEENAKNELHNIKSKVNSPLSNIHLDFIPNYFTYKKLEDMSNCFLCSKSLSKLIHYICNECVPSIGICQECLQSSEHHHNLYVVFNESKENLQTIIHHNFKWLMDHNFALNSELIFKESECYVCKIKPIANILYKCANCLDINICPNCFNTIEESSTSLIKPQDKSFKMRHEIKGHCYIRLKQKLDLY